MNEYTTKLLEKANEYLKFYMIFQYEHLMVTEFIENEDYKKNELGFINYLTDILNADVISIEEYKRLIELV